MIWRIHLLDVNNTDFGTHIEEAKFKDGHYSKKPFSILIGTLISLIEIWLLDSNGSEVVTRNPSSMRYLIGVSPMTETANIISNFAHEALHVFLLREYLSVNQSSFHVLIS